MARKILTGIDLNGQRGQNFADPSAANDAATKSYVDNLAAGLAWKPIARAATTANVTLSGTQTIDGVALIAGDRVLVKDQSTASGNGIYVVAAGAWSRATDADSAAELVNATVLVSEGTNNADNAWTQTVNAPITVGTTGLTFAQFGGGGAAYTAGNGLTLTSQDFAVGAGTGISVGADTVGIDTAVVVRKYAATIGDGSTTAIAVTHNLGTKDITYSLQVVSTGEFVDTDATATSTNVLTLTFPTAPTAGQYRVVVHA